MVCILEGSGKWPDSIDAIKRLKAAYYLSLSQALSKIAPSILSATYTNYLEVYKVCNKIVRLFFGTVPFYTAGRSWTIAPLLKEMFCFHVVEKHRAILVKCFDEFSLYRNALQLYRHF